MKRQLEAQVRSLTENLAAEKERADYSEKELLLEQSKRAKTAACTVTIVCACPLYGLIGAG